MPECADDGEDARSPQRRPLSIVGDDTLPDVQVVEAGTVPMTDEQHSAAVHALAVLIDNWRAAQSAEADDADERRVA